MAQGYTSKVKIDQLSAGVRRAELPLGESVLFGVHDAIARHYRMEPGTYEPHSATLDYLVAAAAG